jgi:hypothetical protein
VQAAAPRVGKAGRGGVEDPPDFPLGEIASPSLLRRSDGRLAGRKVREDAGVGRRRPRESVLVGPCLAPGRLFIDGAWHLAVSHWQVRGLSLFRIHEVWRLCLYNRKRQQIDGFGTIRHWWPLDAESSPPPMKLDSHGQLDIASLGKLPLLR